ncbi:hypothetical protein AC480_03635 [miscellaneous Crenarchaeota group archaeon SMTZ1-55]|nr:MAG: hypothetical protein AC480_03635 [miscellaneous Crenarchaeota group archaeon SMTZ1-55]
MRVLIVTGQLAKDTIAKYVEEGPVEAQVLALPTSVAALLSPSIIKTELRGRSLKGFHLILVPGLVRGDVSIVEKAVGIPTFKGPKYGADLPLVLSRLGHVTLSSTLAADEVLKAHQRHRVFDELRISREKREALLKREGSLAVGNVGVGRGFPLRVMAELLDAPTLTDSEVLAKAEYYVASGADIIDIGMVAGESLPKDAARAVRVVKDSFSLPVAIDTYDVDEARAGVSAGADMVLSVDWGNAEEVAAFASDIPVVVTSTNQRRAYVPTKASMKVAALEENIRQAVHLGMKKVVGDLIVHPLNTPGIMECLVAYHEFSKRNPTIPLLFGSGNVTELTDADSVGVNALLAGMASELKVSILLTTEGSVKTTGSVRELATAAKMMFLAETRNSTPKDLGVDLLLLKDKRLKDESYEKTWERNARIIEAAAEGEDLDPKGCFRILIDRKEKKLVAIHHLAGSRPTIIRGEKAEDVCSTIINMRLISTLNHASYVGKELEKAELALRIGKSYIQDEALFPAYEKDEVT